MESLINNMLFGVVISLIAFELALIIRKKTGIVLLNPLLVSIIMVIAFLLLFNIDVEIYNVGGDFINMFLGPATVVLAVPLYNQLDNLKRYFAVPSIAETYFSTISRCVSTHRSESFFRKSFDKLVISSKESTRRTCIHS